MTPSRTFLLLMLLIGTFACNDDEPITIVQDPVNNFFWNSMNSWYFWQDEVQPLADDISQAEKANFLNQFSSPYALFEELRHEEDRFSWIVEDYEALNNLFQGITESFGYEFGLVRLQGDSVVGYVQYVIPGSPADQSGLKRGDLFYAVNDEVLTAGNYQRLLYSNPTYSLSLGSLDNGKITAKNQTPVITAIQLEENPVHMAKVIEFENKRIGYLVYNGFTHTYHAELNAAFGLFKEQNIDELVIDFRYNPGGSIYTAMHLGSLIYGNGTGQQTFCKLLYNTKRSESNLVLPFVNQMDVINGDYESLSQENLNELFLDRVYILTGSGTASASELVIAGLLPYMDVKVVGAVTRGKNEGSRTLYDSPKSDYTEKESSNLLHKWALQPIVTKLANSEDWSDYSTGFVPDVEVNEADYIANILPLGDPEEPLLKVVLLDITGKGSIGRLESGVKRELVHSSRIERKHQSEMHLGGIDF
ncbi:MAG: hypothetical protein JXQ90_06390 [Cyclobacteriaceae bacterium]